MALVEGVRLVRGEGKPSRRRGTKVGVVRYHPVSRAPGFQQMLIVPVHPQSGKRVNRVGTRGLVEHEGHGGCEDVENELLKRLVLSISWGRVRSTLCVCPCPFPVFVTAWQIGIRRKKWRRGRCIMRLSKALTPRFAACRSCIFGLCRLSTKI
jgi:hypothetical protein